MYNFELIGCIVHTLPFISTLWINQDIIIILFYNKMSIEKLKSCSHEIFKGNEKKS